MKLTLREISTASWQAAINSRGLSGRGIGYVFAFWGTVLFSMKAILVKLAYQPTAGLPENALDAITIMTLRLGFSFPVYVAVLLIVLRRRAEPVQLKDAGLAMLLGMLGYYICAWLDIQGLKYITSQLERLLLFTYPIFVFIFGAMFFGKPLTRMAVLSILIAYAGIGVIFLGGDIAIGQNVPLGTAMILTCAAAFAFFQLFAKPMIARLGTSVFTCFAMMGAGTAIFTHFIIEHSVSGTLGTSLDLPPRIWMLGVALAFFSTLVPSFLVNIGIARIGPQATSAMGMLSPIVTIILAVWWLSEPFGRFDALGTLLTIFGIGLYTWSDRRAQIQPISPAPRHT